MIYEIDVLGDQKLGLKEGGEARDEGLRCLSISLMTTALRQVSRNSHLNAMTSVTYMEFPPMRSQLTSSFPRMNLGGNAPADVDIKKSPPEVLVI